MRMLSTVDALLPLSLLEAVRNIDTPAELDSEFVDELRNKRLGLSDTVYLQIKRYSDAVRKNQRTAQDESVALAKLIGRRPDAESVFRAAGRYLAREAYGTISLPTRRLLRLLPSVLARPLALRRARDRAALHQRDGAARRCVCPAGRAAFGHAQHRAGQHRLRVLRSHAARAADAPHRRRRIGGSRPVRRSRRGHLRVARRLENLRGYECSIRRRCRQSRPH
jgi:hypothetical protein